MHHKTRGAEAKERGKISLFEKSSVCHFGGLKAKKRLLPKYCCQNIGKKLLLQCIDNRWTRPLCDMLIDRILFYWTSFYLDFLGAFTSCHFSLAIELHGRSLASIRNLIINVVSSWKCFKIKAANFKAKTKSWSVHFDCYSESSE